jgi:hypothetical protein
MFLGHSWSPPGLKLKVMDNNFSVWICYSQLICYFKRLQLRYVVPLWTLPTPVMYLIIRLSQILFMKWSRDSEVLRGRREDSLSPYLIT